VRGIKDFKPPEDEGITASAGRGWRASELRLKSFEDLHMLWYVLLKERNMLATLKADATAKGMRPANPSRIRKVRRSMARIKHVLWERKLAADAAAAAAAAAETKASETM